MFIGDNKLRDLSDFKKGDILALSKQGDIKALTAGPLSKKLIKLGDKLGLCPAKYTKDAIVRAMQEQDLLDASPEAAIALAKLTQRAYTDLTRPNMAFFSFNTPGFNVRAQEVVRERQAAIREVAKDKLDLQVDSGGIGNTVRFMKQQREKLAQQPKTQENQERIASLDSQIAEKEAILKAIAAKHSK